jgi:hypothetical protein
MRVILALASATVALSLSGCDIRGGDQKPATACNCATPPAAATTTTPPPDMRGSTAYMPPAIHHRRHYRPRGYAYGSGHHGTYYWRKEYSEVSVAMYDYHSGSTSSYFGGESYGGDDYHGGHGGGGYHGAAHGWIDGYGRGHDGYVGDAVHHESGADDGRDRPWHGYDADCPDDPHHH